MKLLSVHQGKRKKIYHSGKSWIAIRSGLTPWQLEKLLTVTIQVKIFQRDDYEERAIAEVNPSESRLYNAVLREENIPTV